MKKLYPFFAVWILVGLLAGCAQAGGASGTPTITPATGPIASFDALIPVAIAFVDEISAGNFAAAANRFDANMKTALPEAKLKDTWAQLISQAGAFQKHTGTLTQEAQGYQIVLVTCEFAKARFYAQVTFNAHGQIAGLYFAPAPAPAEIK